MNDQTAPPTAAASQVFGGVIGAASDAQRAIRKRWHSIPRPVRLLIGVGGIAVLYLLPIIRPPFLTTTTPDFSSLLARNVVIYVLIALGLNVVVGMAGLLDLGYVGFYAIGAYTVGILSSQHGNLPWLICLPIAVAVSMLSGAILGAPTLRLRGDYLAIVTLGFGEIIRLLAKNFDWLGAAGGIKAIPPPPNIGPFKFGVLNNNSYYYLGLTIVIIVYFFIHRLEHSRVGRSWTAIREDEDAAALMGVPTFKFKMWAFAIGAAIGGLAGTLYATKAKFINPDNFELKLSILFLAAVVLGGPGNQFGVIIGAFLVSWTPERFREIHFFGLNLDFSTSRYFWFGLALVIIMIFRPQGLFPRRLAGRRRNSSVDPDEPLVDGGVTEHHVALADEGIPE